MRLITKLTWEWAIRCFGAEHVDNIPVRALRTAEEAVELSQVCGIPKEMMHKLVDIVYSRPKGSFDSEVGGLMLTTACLAASCGGREPQDLFENELRRVLAKPIEHFAVRNQEKIAMGLTLDAGLFKG